MIYDNAGAVKETLVRRAARAVHPVRCVRPWRHARRLHPQPAPAPPGLPRQAGEPAARLPRLLLQVPDLLMAPAEEATAFLAAAGLQAFANGSAQVQDASQPQPSIFSLGDPQCTARCAAAGGAAAPAPAPSAAGGGRRLLAQRAADGNASYNAFMGSLTAAPVTRDTPLGSQRELSAGAPASGGAQLQGGACSCELRCVLRCAAVWRRRAAACPAGGSTGCRNPIPAQHWLLNPPFLLLFHHRLPTHPRDAAGPGADARELRNHHAAPLRGDPAALPASPL